MVTGTLPGRQEVGHVDPAVVGWCVVFGGRTHPLYCIGAAGLFPLFTLNNRTRFPIVAFDGTGSIGTASSRRFFVLFSFHWLFV